MPGIVLNAHKRDKISAKMKFIVHWRNHAFKNILKKYNSIIVKILPGGELCGVPVEGGKSVNRNSGEKCEVPKTCEENSTFNSNKIG